MMNSTIIIIIFKKLKFNYLIIERSSPEKNSNDYQIPIVRDLLSHSSNTSVFKNLVHI